MKGRRIAAMLCVLLGHAFLVFALLDLTQPVPRGAVPIQPSTLLFFIESYEEEPAEPTRAPSPDLPDLAPRLSIDTLPTEGETPEAVAAEQSGRGFVDWPREARDSAARVLAREREAERVARMFAGPDGTWASLTKRQRSELSKFRWAPGVDGLERDENGNTIYQMKNGCVLVNFLFFGCPIGKAKVHGDMFENMREYFDEQRLPRTDEGNGTEPESRRPPKWSKPLPERR